MGAMVAGANGYQSKANFSAGVGNPVGGATRDSLESTLNKLKQQRDEVKQEKNRTNDSALDTRITNLEQRIQTLQSRIEKLKEKQDGECQTCKNRKYQDGSDDPGVSFKTAGKIAPEVSAAVVKSHENEHVVRDRAEADREGREVVSQTVRLKHGICPECGTTYVAGGVTETVTRTKSDSRFDVGTEPKHKQRGNLLNKIA